jgi:archaeosine-15-forming tRNA-guanine transglycosylase
MTLSKNNRTTAAKLTPELNIYHEDSVSIKSELHKSNIHGRAAIAKYLITVNKATRRKNGVMIIKPGRLMIGNT